MRNYVIASILAAVAVLAFLGVVPSYTASNPNEAKDQNAASTPDLSGIWAKPRGAERSKADDSPNYGFSKDELPMQPRTLEEYKVIRKGMKPTEKGRDDLDPKAACVPHGLPRSYNPPFPFEIVQTPEVVYELFEANHEVRRIFMDGRPHPKGAPAAWMGHSIGKYEGDTLVVDSIGFNDYTWIDSQGHPHSDAFHFVERIRRPDHDTLEIKFVFDDAKAYTAPWTGIKMFKLEAKGEILDEITCEDHYRDDHYKQMRDIISQEEKEAK